jgi:hypothetical protein
MIFIEPYTAFVKIVVWLEGSRFRHPSMRLSNRRHYPLLIAVNALMIFDSKFYIN